MSFEELRKTYSLNAKAFLKYAQLTSILSKFPRQYLEYNVEIDSKLRRSASHRGTVSGLYKLLICSSSKRPHSVTVGTGFSH